MIADAPQANGTPPRTLPVALPRRSAFLVRWFSGWVRGYLKKHFHAVRLARGTQPDVPADVPLVVVLNHPSWWDPLLGIVLAGLFSVRTHYVPMDARMLDRYRLFKWLGFYGVEQGPRGATAFLRTTAALLARPNSAVWITAQGRFTDPRTRPPGLRPGIGHLARRLPRGVVVPLALEYPFWEERLPEALARFGLEIEGFGGGAVLVRGMPALLGNPDPAPLLRDLAEELADGQGPAALADRVDAAIARIACHGSVRAGRRLAPAEMDALLRALEATPRAATCSHGRPTVLKLDRAGLERLFGRR